MNTSKENMTKDELISYIRELEQKISSMKKVKSRSRSRSQSRLVRRRTRPRRFTNGRRD